MSWRVPPPLLAAGFVLLLAFSACSGTLHPGASHPNSTPVAGNLDIVFTSPTGRYTIRVNHDWGRQELASQAGIVDYFILPNANFSVVSANVIPGTTLETWLQSTLQQYRQAKIQGIERKGTVDVGGGRAELIRARTYVNARNETVYAPPSPDSRPRMLYQAFYLAGDVSFTFSIAWSQSDQADYVSLFRSLLHTFTLAGAT